METKILQSINLIRRGSGASLNLFRYAAMVLVLLMLGIGNAWGSNTYYSALKATSNNTAQGLVYASLDGNASIGSYTNENTTDTKSSSTSGQEDTFYASAKGGRGFVFSSWTKGSGTNSITNLSAETTAVKVKEATSNGSTNTGTVTASFTTAPKCTLTYKVPLNAGEYTILYKNDYVISNNKFTTSNVVNKTMTTSTASNEAVMTYESDVITLTVTKRESQFLGWFDATANTKLSSETTFALPWYNANKTIEPRWKEFTPIAVTFQAVEGGMGTYTVNGSTTVSTSNYAYSDPESDEATFTLVATVASDAYRFVGWYKEDNQGKQTIVSTESTLTNYVIAEPTKFGAKFEAKPTHLNITFKAVEKDEDSNLKGSYTVGSTAVSATDYVVNTGDSYYFEQTLTATPAEGYMFGGWYTLDGKTKNFFSTATTYSAHFEESIKVYAYFVKNNYTEDQKAQFKVGSIHTKDLNYAIDNRGSNTVIICESDGILPPGNYTIPSGVTLLIPYSTSESLQTTPAISQQSAPALSIYRKLIMVEGANITCNGNICVAGQIASMDGGQFSGYPVGACGVLDMSTGGNITLNNGSVLYAWGFVKGQDMDQGNNTVGMGTIVANSGAIVWEDFAEENRGGSASSDLVNNNSYRTFPFQGYAIQNIEVPVTYKHGATLKNYTSLYIKGNQTSNFPVIGSSDALFLLKDSKSVVTKWYDPTTDLACYELSGTAQLDAIVASIYVSVNSKDYNLPLSSNMRIILRDCNMTLSKPIQILPDAIIEITESATVNLETNLFLFDVDEWQKGVNALYYATYKNLTSHKNRGDGTSKTSLGDAKLIVDGTLNVTSTGRIYATAGGANIMGNGGGKIVFPATLASSSNLYQLWGAAGGTKTSTSITISYFLASDAYLEAVPVNTANLCNENGNYTKSIANKTFYNVHGRWFVQGDQNEKDDHTYSFTYINNGVNNSTSGTTTTGHAVYSWDKTGLELRQKWMDVTGPTCTDWWTGTDTYFYNWSLSSAWHQFQPTATAGMYSGSNNKIYTKTDCDWEELGETDANCLYLIGGRKKALVDGQFIELEPNADDAAFHAVANPTQYYISFAGCNWHEATKIEGEKKAYIVDDLKFIWFENDWLQAEREIPFFYTYDETNVKVYYEYIGSEWVIAEPYVKVKDAFETRMLMTLPEAFTIASGKTNPTITILRDMPNVATSAVFTGKNQTCTLDLNGHTVTSSCEYLIHVNASGCTFTILDNTTDKKGELRACPSGNARKYGYKVSAGTLKLQSGKMYATNAMERQSSGNTSVRITGLQIVKGATFNMTGGIYECIDEYNNYGIQIDGDASTKGVMNLSGGKVIVHATKWDSPYGILVNYGKLNLSGTGSVECYADKSSTAYGVSVSAAGSYGGEFNMTGGSVYAKSYTSSTRGVQVNGNVTVTGDYNATTPDNTPKSRGYATANISGGTITSETETSTSAFGVLSYGTTTISGGTITATVLKSNQNTAWGVRVDGGTTTISGSANIIANAPTIAYGVLVQGVVDGTRGWCHYGVLNVNGGTITANTTASTRAYGLYVTATTKNLARTDGYKVFNGDYAAHGTATITGGSFIANAKTTSAEGIHVEGTKTLNAASATPVCTINGGYYKVTGTGDLLGCNTAASTDNFHINGGYYSHDGNLATYVASPKHVLTLASGDANRPPYYYKVAEAYQVTFKNEDGTANIIDPIYQEVNTKPVCSTEPTKASNATNSFTFDGWATEANGAKVYEPDGLPNVTSAGATYYAHFATTTLKYRVHLDATTNGGECATENIYVNPGAAVGTLPTATKYGYTFNGWYTAATGGTKLATTTVINANADYYAQFTANSHNLTWNLTGGKVSTAGKIGSTTWPAANATGTPSTSVAYGTVLTTIPVVAKTGYVFNRWDPVPTSSMPDNDVTYAALWNPATNTKYYVKHYQQNIYDDNYTLVETETKTGTTDATVTPARKSYDGFLTPDPQQLTIGAAGTSELAYNYNRVVYTIYWNANTNGGACATISTDVRHGATLASMPVATKAGFVFDGWYTQAEGGTKITTATAIQQNYGTLYAHFVTVHNLTWNLNGGSTSSTTHTPSGSVAVEALITYPEASTMSKTGCTFAGWDQETYLMPDNDLTITAQWSVNTHKLAWNFDGGTPSGNYTEANNVLAYGSAITYPTLSKTGYTFAGWSTNATSMPDADLTITASWTVNTHKLAWNFDGGTPSGNYTEANNALAYGSAITYPTLSKTGYTFAGWSTNATSMPDADLTITASWTVNTHKLAWNFDGGTLSGNYTEANNALAYGSTITYPTLSKTGYTFAGWSTNATSMPDADLTITASWTVNTHKLAWNFDGGTPSGNYTEANNVLAYGSTITYPTLSKTGYTFAGWSTNATSMPDADLTITASWTVNTHKLAWNFDGGTPSGNYTEANNALAYGSAITYPTLSKTGYTFAGWSTNATSMPDADLTITASWTPNTNTAYSVEHYWQNIVDDNYTKHETVNMTGTTDAPTAAVAKNYSGFEAQSFSQGTVAPDGSLVVKIYYNRKTYTIIWDVKLNGEQEAYKEETLRYGATPSYGDDPTKEQSESQVFSFSGWNPTPYAVDKDQTYTGSFNVAPRPYTIRFVNDNGSELQSSQVGWGSTPTYNGETPEHSYTGDGYTYTFTGWKPELAPVSGSATYTAVYSRSAESITVNTEETVTDNTSATTTTVENGGTLTVGDKNNGVTLQSNTIIVESGGQLDVADNGSIAADVFIIQATTEDQGEDDAKEEVQVSGEMSETGSKNIGAIYYDLTRKHGTENFLARVWYAVAVPWAVETPNYSNGGVYIKQGDNYVQQRLGETFDLITYDGHCRATQGASADCWVYLEDEIFEGADAVMVPGKLYMIYLTEETSTIRFKKADDDSPIHTNSLTVSACGGSGNDANWNGIANPATYRAYMNVAVEGLVQKFVPGTQPRDGGRYLPIDLSDKQSVGQPFFVQVASTTESTIQVTRHNPSASAPRRVQAQSDPEVRYAISIAANGKLADRLYIQTAEEKEDEYIIGKDMSKMSVSSRVAQIWVNRYDSKLCLNTAVLDRDKASYPLGIYAPQAGEYKIFAPADIEMNDNIYLTLDDRVIWNLTMAPYYASLEQGTTNRYGLKLVRSNAPAVSTDVENLKDGTYPAAQKIIIEDKVYILRGEKLYTITGQLVQ
ncbi:MAG: InlB B-repeat-containing protein [Paludibacteraceae bacterium]|nr:InlB B-repeat-containing protein [Paludibacteraceae bacterium]